MESTNQQPKRSGLISLSGATPEAQICLSATHEDEADSATTTKSGYFKSSDWDSVKNYTSLKKDSAERFTCSKDLGIWDYVCPYNNSICAYVFNDPVGHTPNVAFKYLLPTPNNIQMSSFKRRLATFEENGYPRQMAQAPIELAQAGFHYTGRGDSVQTFCCGKIFSQWHYQDKPWDEHRRHSPYCPLFKLKNKE